MRLVALPNYNPTDVYITCINNISDQNLLSRLQSITPYINAAARYYKDKGDGKQFYLITPNHCENDEVVLGAVTKSELKWVYSTQMVGRSKPGRAIYDSLLSLAPLGKCPLCGFGHATTLDHYLPKTLFPQLSVLPLNLVPSCKDCNTGKSASIAATDSSQTLHPYFDHDQFINEQWLYAEVVQGAQARIRFYVNAPSHWDDISKARVQSHFDDFKLAKRYAVEAGSQLACLKDILEAYRTSVGADAVRQNLTIEALSREGMHKNSWQTAMYQALVSSDWYCEGGYLLISN